MITKEQYDVLRCHVANLDDAPRSVVAALIAEYERANPPTPEVPCPVCGAKMLRREGGTFWMCSDHEKCCLYGPNNDPDGKKVMAMGKRKLPLSIHDSYYVDNGKAYEMPSGIVNHKGLGDQIDISEWFE